MKLSGWGRYPVVDCTVSAPRSETALRAQLLCGPAIAHGNGRAYGDCAINAANTISMRRFNRMLAFDPDTGQLVAEAGVILGDVAFAFVPRGWFPPVTPGTKFVTLGGMVAADVHGKNHHRDGSFGAFVDWIDVMVADGSVIRCSPDENVALFERTVGGMGLTGIILRVAFRLRPVESGWIVQTTIPAHNLDAAMEAFEGSLDATYSVAWIDCLATGSEAGRSLILFGEHARLADLHGNACRQPLGPAPKRKKTLPIDAPRGLLNGLTVRAFNALYWRNGLRSAGTRLVDWDSYFYPLDAILGWNRIYGRRGFVQFQCALPLAASRDGLAQILNEIASAGQGSFLAVLKRFGSQDSQLSFPMEGYTLALDFPVSTRCLALIERLDRITIEHGGRFYLAKDGRMTPQTLRSSDPRWARFAEHRVEAGEAAAFRSAQSERLAL
ncbi:MAG: FAD-binding oxidoreductase [Pseudomonadota bacterium]